MALQMYSFRGNISLSRLLVYSYWSLNSLRTQLCPSAVTSQPVMTSQLRDDITAL